MSKALDRRTYERLRDAMLTFVADHPHTAVEPFKESTANWGHKWCAGNSFHLRAAEYLTSALSSTTEQTRALTALFERERAGLKWERTYTEADPAVSADLIERYGFVEFIGEEGPFVSDRVRAGVGAWGPYVHYPAHRHQAEEIYILLAGSAYFQFNAGPARLQRAGDAVYVPSMLTHGFRTGADPLVVLYVWQAGDLREKSTFV
ncbi:MAG: dimethylsulfonioproprionate lyase family protein [Hyphomicrobiaceae bacterium]